MRPSERANRRALILLAVGGVSGVLLGFLSAFRDGGSSPGQTLSNDVIALVNGKPIREDEYVSALALLAGDQRSALTKEDRAQVLTRLIEEELLVQYGVASGVVDTDRSVRKVMTQALLDSIVAESASELPTEEELRSFYEQHLSLFTASAQTDGAPEKTTIGTPPFPHVRTRVAAMYLQYVRDEALREYLDWLHAEAKITLAPEMR